MLPHQEFSEAFTIVDIVFMSFTVIALYYALKSFDFLVIRIFFYFQFFQVCHQCKSNAFIISSLFTLLFIPLLEEKEYLKKI